MSDLKKDLQTLIDSATLEQEYMYVKFKNGEIRMILIGDGSRGYDDADKWWYWCYNGRLFFDSYFDGIDELDNKLIPTIFFDPIFRKEKITPYSQIFEKWRKSQQEDKFKYRLENSNPTYMFEIGDDHVIRYVRGRGMERIHELSMFTIFSDPPEDKNLISKSEFLSLPPLSPPIVRLRRKGSPSRLKTRKPSL